MNELHCSKLIHDRDLTDYHLAGSHLMPNKTSEELEHLRGQLYIAKDELTSCSKFLSKMVQKCPNTWNLAARIEVLHQNCVSTEQTLSTYLTNNGSEWLDSLLSGGLTFREFRKLNYCQFIIQIRRFKKFLAQIAIAENAWREGKFNMFTKLSASKIDQAKSAKASPNETEVENASIDDMPKEDSEWTDKSESPLAGDNPAMCGIDSVVADIISCEGLLLTWKMILKVKS
jgi:hypothetical protein